MFLSIPNTNQSEVDVTKLLPKQQLNFIEAPAMDKENEQLSIQVRNQVIQERSLIKVEGHTTFIFQTIFCCFGSSLLMQLITLLPNSYKLINQLPVIISLILIGVSGVLVVIKKAPTVKTYLLVIAVCFGLLMGS
ncbi:MAG: hypothetical protein KME29_15730 [Calothrix sp. FI2-JRJ7]|nr:hypothetical protein [Calothrix sp. FI2-JRJ7]